jgi:anaerobic magnesium-protoporphyrin IX monomethyl ester cyclase
VKILLVGPDYEENLSIRYLCSSLRAAGHAVTLASFLDASDIPRVIDAAKGAQIVGLSMCFEARAREFLELARQFKQYEPDRIVLAGGHYASCGATELLEHHPEIDLIVIHEGEQTIVELANSGADLIDRLPSITGLAYRSAAGVRFTPPRPILQDLDSLPWPDRDGPIRLLTGVPTSYLMGSRGCTGSCDYCCITTLHRLAPGARFRRRDPERVAEEMACLYHRRGSRQFVFHDDNFLVPDQRDNHHRLDRLERALAERGVRDIGLVLKCRPAEVEAGIFARLKKMGLIRLFLGIESGSTPGLQSLGRHQEIAASERALELCQSMDISAQYTIMTFHPEATVDTIKADIAFMRRHIAHPLNFCRAEIYSGTPLEARMISEGRAHGNYLGRSYRITDSAADLATKHAVRLFVERCWTNASVLNTAIRNDHMAAILGRFYSGPEVARARAAVRAWMTKVNENSISKLEALVDACAAASGGDDPALGRFVERFSLEEKTECNTLMKEGTELRYQIDSLALTRVGLARSKGRLRRIARPAQELARHAAAVAIAFGLACAAGCSCEEVNEMAPPPMDGGAGHTGAAGQGGAAIGQGGGNVGGATGTSTTRSKDAAADVMDVGYHISEMAPPPTDDSGT